MQDTDGWIGRALPRREDAALLRGMGRFVDDIAPDGCLFLEVVRSPFGAGVIAALDVGAARGMPGVVAVYTAADMVLHGVAGVNPLLDGARLVPMQALARDAVVAGQAVAFVVATSRMAARDAAEAVGLEVAPRAPLAVESRAHWGEPLGFAGGVVARVDHALVAPMAMEPRAVVAVPEGLGLLVYLSTQTPQRCRDDLCAVLGLARDLVRVVAPDVGGAFGGKASLMPEDVMVAFAARALGRAVKWCATRSEEFLAATVGRGARTFAQMDMGVDGVARGLQADLRFDLGHWMPYSALAPIRNAGRILPGPYAMPVDVTGVAATSAGPAVNIYRGAGRPEAAMLMERLMDRAAQALGVDPIALRRRNLGTDLGDFGGLLDRLELEAGYVALRAGVLARRAAGEVCGLGVALYLEPCGQGWETASLELGADGRYLATTGSSAQGQGRETAMAQIAAQALGVCPDMVDVVEGDTLRVPEGIGALASRSTAIGGAAMWRAGVELRAKVAAGEGPFRVEVRHEAEAEAWASGAVLAQVGVDADTGVLTVEQIVWVDDVGVVVNPMLVQGQLMGGAAQGIGAALMERLVFDAGQLQTGSLMDYAVPRAADMPPIRLISQPTRSPANPLGVKGVGEAGCIGVPAAILNAVMDVMPAGTPDLALPLTAEKVWRCLRGDRP